MSEVQSKGLTAWLKQNQLWGTLAGMAGGALVTGALWYSSVNAMNAKVLELVPKIERMDRDLANATNNINQLQKDMTNADVRMNGLRAAIDNTNVTIQEARSKLETADYRNQEAAARLDERMKGLELHSPPLSFAPASARGAQR